MGSGEGKHRPERKTDGGFWVVVLCVIIALGAAVIITQQAPTP